MTIKHSFKILKILNNPECNSADPVDSYPYRMHFGRIHTLYVIKFVGLSVMFRSSPLKVFLEISRNSQEKASARLSFLVKLQALCLRLKRLWHRCSPVNFAKFLRTYFFTEHLWWLLLYVYCTYINDQSVPSC